jgi:hypothetical protein
MLVIDLGALAQVVLFHFHFKGEFNLFTKRILFGVALLVFLYIGGNALTADDRRFETSFGQGIFNKHFKLSEVELVLRVFIHILKDLLLSILCSVHQVEIGRVARTNVARLPELHSNNSGQLLFLASKHDQLPYKHFYFFKTYILPADLLQFVLDKVGMHIDVLL